MTDPRLDELFARYWDDALSAEGLAELERMLREDPAARSRFRTLSLVSVASADHAALAATAPPRRRRRVVMFAAAAAVLLAALLAIRPGREAGRGGRAAWPGAIVVRATGAVLRVGGQEKPAVAGESVAPGGTVTTRGVGSSAVLAYPDGSTVSLAGDSAATLRADERPTLYLARGQACANVAPPREGGSRLELATPEATARPGDDGARLTLSRKAGRTEVGVYEGSVVVSRPGGGRLLGLSENEVGTIDGAGFAAKSTFARPALEYSFDFVSTPAVGWEAGRVGPDSITAEFWDDPCIGRSCQARSGNGWTRGLFALYPDTKIRARFRVARPGRGQFLIVVRPEPIAGREAVVLEVPRPFATARPGQWETVELRADQLVPETRAPAFGPPWVGFLVIFNTYEADLGLEVAEFQVSRPNRP